MALIAWIRRRREAKLVEQQVDTFTARCIKAVRECVEPRSHGLPTAEARGYIRARATHVLLAAVEKGATVPASLHGRIVAESVERIADVLLDRRSRQSETRSLRRAA